MADTQSLAERVERQLEQLARRMVETFVAQVPIYQLLPTEQLEGEILQICRENLHIFFRCVREQRPPTAEELAEPGASAARRAEERVPLDAVLSAYHIGGRIGWEALAAEAREDEGEALADATRHVLEYVEHVTNAVAAAYLEEQQHIHCEEHDAVRVLTDALLSGGGDGSERQRLERLAGRAGMELAPSYLALALHLGKSPEERDGGVTGRVAGRRKVRRVSARLEEVAGQPILTELDGTGGMLLVPLDDQPEAVAGRASELVAAAAEACEAEVHAGAAAAGIEGIPAAAAEASQVLRVVEALGHPPGAYRIDDVLLEHAVAQSASASRRLVALLEPLADKADLLETLEQWFANDFDRKSTANALHVHPNTLDYRLRRVSELTELDPGTAQGLQLLGAALAARRAGAAFRA